MGSAICELGYAEPWRSRRYSQGTVKEPIPGRCKMIWRNGATVNGTTPSHNRVVRFTASGDSAFYNPATARFPARYVGDYFFADFCSGWIRRLDLAQGTVTQFKGMSDEGPVSLQVGSNGSLYFLARGTGSVERIRYVGS